MEETLSIFKNILKLPPIEQRPDIQNSRIARFAGVWFPTSEKDDIYIFYLNALWTFRIAASFAIFYMVCYILKLDLSFKPFSIASDKKVSDLLKNYNYVVSSILLFLIYPFFFLKYASNIKIKSHDVLWYNKNYISQESRSRWKIIPFAITGVIVALLIIRFGSIISRGFPLNIFYSETLISYALYLFVLCVGFALFMQILLTSTIMLWRYIGRFEGR